MESKRELVLGALGLLCIFWLSTTAVFNRFWPKLATLLALASVFTAPAVAYYLLEKRGVQLSTLGWFGLIYYLILVPFDLTVTFILGSVSFTISPVIPSLVLFVVPPVMAYVLVTQWEVQHKFRSKFNFALGVFGVYCVYLLSASATMFLPFPITEYYVVLSLVVSPTIAYYLLEKRDVPLSTLGWFVLFYFPIYFLFGTPVSIAVRRIPRNVGPIVSQFIPFLLLFTVPLLGAYLLITKWEVHHRVRSA